MCAGPTKSGQISMSGPGEQTQWDGNTCKDLLNEVCTARIRTGCWLQGPVQCSWMPHVPHFFAMATTSTVEMAEEVTHTVSDGIATEFATYEDFLDWQITPMDFTTFEVC